MNIFEDTDVEYKYIVHISDIHIRNNERRKEYEAVFKKLIESLSKIEENFIIAITGDIVHSKTELSPEALYLSRELSRTNSFIFSSRLISISSPSSLGITNHKIK